MPHLTVYELPRLILYVPQVVLANGSAVTASADQHDDLFWALKGGSNNFGKYSILKSSIEIGH